MDHQEPQPPRRRGGRTFPLLMVGMLAGVLLAVGVDHWTARPVHEWVVPRDRPVPATPVRPTVPQLLLMPDADLARYSPAELNALVAAGPAQQVQPDDVRQTLTQWARQLRPPTTLRPPTVTRDQREQFWIACVGRLQEQFGVKIAEAPSASKEAKDLYVHLGLAEKTLTSHTLPLVLEFLSREWAEPLALAADNDRLVCRLECAGEPSIHLVFSEKGVSRLSDAELTRLHGIPVRAVENGSDLKSLSNRQLLAWFIGQRSGVLLARGEVAGAEADLLLARSVFPDSRSLFLRMHQLMGRRGPQVLGSTAWAMLTGDQDAVNPLAGPRLPRTPEEIMQLNEANRRQFGLNDPLAGLPQTLMP